MNQMNTRREKQEEVENIVDNLTLFDDDLMSRCFDENIPATEYLLHVILNRDIRVIRVKGQSELKNPIVGGRNIRLDIEAEDMNGEKFNTEVQRNHSGADVRRARFHSSMLDSRMLKEKQKFSNLKDSYVIFITEKDYFKEGRALYTINRVIDETGRDFGDGSHIIYVNGTYRGNDEIGRLMKDFHCKQASQISNPLLAKSVRHYKEGEGREEMCEAVQNYGDKREQRGIKLGEQRGEQRGIKLGEIKATIRAGIRYGAEKETIIEDLMSQFSDLSREDAEKLYSDYTK